MRETLGDAQRRRAVAREREGAHRRARRRLRRRIEAHRAERRARRRRGVAARQPCLGGPDERVEPARAPQRPLRAEPGFEAVLARERQSLEEFSFHERRRGIPFPPLGEGGEAVAVECDAVRGEPHLIDVGLDGGVAQRLSQHAQRFAQRVTGLLLVAVAP